MPRGVYERKTKSAEQAVGEVRPAKKSRKGRTIDPTKIVGITMTLPSGRKFEQSVTLETAVGLYTEGRETKAFTITIYENGKK